MNLIYVACGGALGSVARYLTMAAVTRFLGYGFPYGTLAVNIIGSCAMGALIGWLAKMSGGFEQARVFIGVGVLGGFTTFSAFSLDVVTLFERGENPSVLVYIFASVTLSVIALFAGLYLMRMVGSV